MLAVQMIAHVGEDTIKSVILIKKLITEDKTKCPIDIDTRASFSITPNLETFEYHAAQGTVTQSNGLASQNLVTEIGRLKRVIRDVLVND